MLTRGRPMTRSCDWVTAGGRTVSGWQAGDRELYAHREHRDRPRDDGHGGALLRDADIALYAAKRAGRNRWSMFDSALATATRERTELETDLRYAVATGELRLGPEVRRGLRDRDPPSLGSSPARPDLAGGIHSAGGGERIDPRGVAGYYGRHALRRLPGGPRGTPCRFPSACRLGSWRTLTSPPRSRASWPRPSLMPTR